MGMHGFKYTFLSVHRKIIKNLKSWFMLVWDGDMCSSVSQNRRLEIFHRELCLMEFKVIVDQIY